MARSEQLSRPPLRSFIPASPNLEIQDVFLRTFRISITTLLELAAVSTASENKVRDSVIEKKNLVKALDGKTRVGSNRHSDQGHVDGKPA